MKKIARWTHKRIDSRTSRYELRSGAKGKGKVLFSGEYWPDSPLSCEQMGDFCNNAGARYRAEGWEVRPLENDDDIL